MVIFLHCNLSSLPRYSHVLTFVLLYINCLSDILRFFTGRSGTRSSFQHLRRTGKPVFPLRPENPMMPLLLTPFESRRKSESQCRLQLEADASDEAVAETCFYPSQNRCRSSALQSGACARCSAIRNAFRQRFGPGRACRDRDRRQPSIETLSSEVTNMSHQRGLEPFRRRRCCIRGR